MTSPSMGVESILKSPVWTTAPIRVWMAKATESAMEWFTWMNSTWNLPARMVWPASTVMSLVVCSRPCSCSFSLISPAVKPGAVDGHVDLLQHVGDGADVILVAVGDEQAPEPVVVLHQIGYVGDHAVDAVHIIAGERHAAVHHDDLAAILIGGHVLADLVETAQRDDFEFFCHSYSFFTQIIGT